MRLTDKLKQARAAAMDKMTALNEAAERDNRAFTADEVLAWDNLKAEVATLDAQLTNAEEREEVMRGNRGDAKPVPGSGSRLVDAEGNVVRALTKTDKLIDTLPHRAARLDEGPPSMGRVLRGAILGDWSKATRIERAMGEGVLAGGGYAVPSELSATWLDNARAASVCMAAGSLTIPMSTSTMRIVRVNGDPTVVWRQEHQPIPESDLIFNAVDLKARTAGILCRVSVELLEDSPIENQAIESAMSAAMGLAFDWAMLSGTGNTTAPNDIPLGLLHAPNVNEIAAVGALGDYNDFIDAYVMVLNANGVPNAWVMNPTTVGVLAKVPTGLTSDKSQLAVPQPLDALPRYVTTTLVSNAGTGTNESAAIVGDFTQLGLALRTGLTLEASRTAADTMSRVEVLIRLYARMDVAILRPRFFTRLIGITH